MVQDIFGIRKSQNPPNNHSEEKPFTCKECSKSFSEEKPFSTSLFTISQEKIYCAISRFERFQPYFNIFSSLSSFVFKYVFKYVLIVKEIIDHDLTENIWNEKRKVVELSVSFSNSSFPTIVMTKLKIPCQHYFQWLLFIDILEKIIIKLLIK